ncbi:MAG TPA: hypothetical protein VFA05_11975 [Gaiellaceae bacterium]|nr:hypothetical protein [Gaiellaceae bacterium]
MSTSAPRADAAAASVGAADLFVLRRVRGNRFVHFGGSGRGAGWAGIVEAIADEEDALREALESRRPVRVGAERKELVFGPYYARAAAFVPVTNDVVVVFGAEDDSLQHAPDDQLMSAATLGAEAVEAVSPAKRLADELEELEAVRAALQVDTADVGQAMRDTCAVAAHALSCEVAAIYLDDGERISVLEEGWRLGSRPERIATALRGVLGDGRFPYCVQDASVVPPPSPLDDEEGVRSYYLLELTGVARGVLFVAHTDAAPRGFTLLCRRLGLRLAEVVSANLGVAVTRAWCSDQAERLHVEFAKLNAT